MCDTELITDDDTDDTGVYINPLTARYVYDSQLDVEFVIVVDEPDNHVFGDDPFNIIAAREEARGCPMALC